MGKSRVKKLFILFIFIIVERIKNSFKIINNNKKRCFHILTFTKTVKFIKNILNYGKNITSNEI